MKQSRFSVNYFHFIFKNLLSFIAHTVSLGLAGLALFMFGFYVIPVFGDTTLRISDSFIYPVKSRPTLRVEQELKQPPTLPSKRIRSPNSDDSDGIPNYQESIEDIDSNGIANYPNWNSANDGISDCDEIGLS